MQTIALIGVPSSAGAHFPGQEKTPQALREAGLIAGLESHGLAVEDYGDVPAERFMPDPEHRSAKNAAAVFRVARDTERVTRAALRSGALPLVIGGDCSITIGVMAALVAHHGDASLLYFDGQPDLNTPLTSPSGILDSMGLAHMLNEEGVLPDLSGLGRRPLLDAADVVVFGYNPLESNSGELAALERLQLLSYALDRVRGNGAVSARAALEKLERKPAPFAMHFDIDVVDFPDLPFANIPQFRAGLPFADAVAALEVFASSPSFGGLILTEVNPDHGDAGGIQMKRLAAAIASVVSRWGRSDVRGRVSVTSRVTSFS